MGKYNSEENELRHAKKGLKIFVFVHSNSEGIIRYSNMVKILRHGGPGTPQYDNYKYLKPTCFCATRLNCMGKMGNRGPGKQDSRT